MSKLLILNKVLLIGSDVRKAGKTDLICKIIKKFAAKTNLIGLKIAIDDCIDSFIIVEEEFDSPGESDTKRMMDAGANRAFFIKTSSDTIYQALESFLNLAKSDDLFIVESLSLRKSIKPGVFIVIDSGSNNAKKRFFEFKQFADVIINHQLNSYIQNIRISRNGWSYLIN